MADFTLTELTYFDYIILAVLALSGFFSMMRGMTREFLGLAGWVAAAFIAVTCSSYFQEWLSTFLKVDGITEILAWTLPFAASVVIWFILASLISPSLKRAGLGALDRWFGGIFGLLRGVLFSMIIYSGCVLYAGQESKLGTGIAESQTGPYISALIKSIQNSTLLPSLVTDSLSSIVLDYHNEDFNQQIDSTIQTTTDTANELNLLADEK
jgi:membrane protein required for colicin V production